MCQDPHQPASRRNPSCVLSGSRPADRVATRGRRRPLVSIARQAIPAAILFAGTLSAVPGNAAPLQQAANPQASEISSGDDPDASRPWQADPQLVERLQERRDHPFNYDEEQVPDYQLPPLVEGRQPDAPAPSDEVWQQRRNELLELFRTHVYGRRPAIDAEISFHPQTDIVDPTGGLAEGQRIVCRVRQGERTFEFPFLIYFPRRGPHAVAPPQPVPLIVLIQNREFPDPQQLVEEPSGFWPLDQILGAGCATAVFHTSDVDPDRADGYVEGIRGFLAEGEPRGPSDWGSLSAWGWAASRVLDYGLSTGRIDPACTAVVGHSRGGKTALWAAAEDPRFRIAYSNESGCGGAALWRRRYGETLERITTSFPHWFCERLNRDYADQEDRLPVDQHQLVATLAPRGVYVASAAEDLWADPRGEYLTVVNAAPAFAWTGQPAITDPQMPPLGEQRVFGATGYHVRPGPHNLTADDWRLFLHFAATRFQQR